MKNLLILSILLTLVSCASQSTADYGKYLDNNKGQAMLTKVSVGKSYYLTENTQAHSKEIKSWKAGIGNSWTIKFAEVIDTTLASHDYKSSLGTLVKTEKESKKDRFLKVNIIDYDFKNHAALIDVKLEVISKGKKVFSKRYTETGNSQGGKMFWGGPFAMKNAIQQSTMTAMNKVFRQFTTDLNKN